MERAEYNALQKYCGGIARSVIPATSTVELEGKEAEHKFGKIDVGTIDPGKCRTNHGFDNWQTAFANKLNATLGTAGVPIDYIIRPEVEDSDKKTLLGR